MLYKCIEYPRVGICKIYQMTLSDRSYGKYWPLNLNLKTLEKITPSPFRHQKTKYELDSYMVRFLIFTLHNSTVFKSITSWKIRLKIDKD